MKLISFTYSSLEKTFKKRRKIQFGASQSLELSNKANELKQIRSKLKDYKLKKLSNYKIILN